jgi:tetratricopeptide (TPR) repeat protein
VLLVVVGLYFLGQQLFAPLPAVRQISFWAALLFAVHPLGIHSVTWISGRKDLMCAAFSIGALLTFSHLAYETENQRNAVRTSLLLIFLSTVCLVLALGSKELAIVVPLAASLLFWVKSETNKPVKVQWLGLLALWATALAMVIYRSVVLGGVGLHGKYPAASFLGNTATSATLWFHYLGRILVPGVPSISDAWPVANSLGLLETNAIFGIVGFALALGYGIYKRWTTVPALLWYVIWTLPATGIIPLRHFRAERYLYPASWGILAVLVILMFKVRSQVKTGVSNRLAKGLLPGFAVLLILTTAYSNTLWWDDEALFSHAVSENPHYVEGRLGLANLALERKNYREAVSLSRQAIKEGQDKSHTAYWSPFVAYSNLGLALHHLGRPVEALQEFQRALRHRPGNSTGHYHVGVAAFNLGDLESAKESYLGCLEINPEDFLCKSNLALTLLHLGEVEKSVKILQPLIQGRPEDLTNMVNFSSGLMLLGEFDQAEHYLEIVVQKRPDDPVQRAKLAWSLWKTGKTSQAQHHLELARQQAPHDPTVLYVANLVGSK